jgi:hypothetical protein
LDRENPKIFLLMRFKLLILAASLISKISSSPLKTLIAKSSEPAMSSCILSSSQSIKSIELTLSPVTVQNYSSPARSSPTIEQLPPAMTRGSLTLLTFPKERQLSPSVISRSNISLFYTTSKKQNYVS